MIAKNPATLNRGEIFRLIPRLHGSPGDAKHRPETRGVAALLTMRILNNLILGEPALAGISKDGQRTGRSGLLPDHFFAKFSKR
jgi:hypothetical protein